MRPTLGLPLLVAALFVSPLAAQQGEVPPWTFRARAVMTGNSSEADPAGYQMYSAVALEAGLTRRFARLLSIELDLRTESREVDFASEGSSVERLGSIELLPVSLFLQLRPSTSGRLHPYAGAGLTFTTAWEKSGVLDSMDVKPHLGPAIDLGLDYDLSGSVLMNLALRWNALTTDIENGGVRYASLTVNPITLGIGLGFRF